MHIALVVPCLNEEKNIAATCASLGFGIGDNDGMSDVKLFIIDNNSTDLTVAIAENIKQNSPKHSVFIGQEFEKGFVPPRHKGNLMAKACAQALNWSLDDTLILQIDADTIYSEDYIASMKSAAENYGMNTIIEARVIYPPTFMSKNARYIELCNKIDSLYTTLFAKDLSDDDIVDDKVSGYRLSDYFDWGGHRREYNSVGAEVYAETSRLYMAGKVRGAKRGFADSAIAFHSTRKIYENPFLHLATAGFPREASWSHQWSQSCSIANDLYNFCMSHKSDLEEAILSRKKHVLAIFVLLPLHVDRALGVEPSVELSLFTRHVLPLLPNRTQSDLFSRPATFLIDVFELILNNGKFLVSEADKLCPL